MKVAIVNQFGVPEVGGGYTYSQAIIEAFLRLSEKSRHEFVFLDSSKGIPLSLKQNLEKNGVKTYTFLNNRATRMLNKMSNRLYELFNLRFTYNPLDSIAKKNKVQFLWFIEAGSTETDLPYLTVVWDLQHRVQPYFPEVSNGGEWLLREKAYSEFLRRASLILVGTDVGKQEVNAFYQVPMQRIKVLPLPTPSFALTTLREEDDEEVMRKYDIQEGYLFYPAQFWSHKNHANLLLAVHELVNNDHRDIKLVLVGSDRGNLEYIKNLVCELRLTEHVRILGFIPVGDMQALYRRAGALVFVSLFGPDNLPPLEAFALGCPVIAANVLGSEEQLGDAVLSVDARNPSQIAAAILQLSNDPLLREELIKRGFERAHKSTGESYVEGVFKILDEFEAIRRCWP